MEYRFIDCHSHPHDKKYLENNISSEDLMQELLDAGGATIAIGTDYKEIEKALDFANKFPNCWVTIGIHPADNHKEVFDEIRFQSYLDQSGKKVVGVGECGLDYFYFDKILSSNPSFDIAKDKERQVSIFKSQIEFALKNNLPLVIHGRPSKNSMDAYRDILDILEEYKKRIEGAEKGEAFLDISLKGHAHFFVGNLEIAKRFLDLGFYLSFDGPITFTNEYDKVIEFTSIERLMIETDSPYAAPLPHRGKINRPIYVEFVAEKIANLKKQTKEEILEQTKNNTIKLFNLNNL